MAEAPVIEAQGLVKNFVEKRGFKELLAHPFRPARRVRALRGVDLTVRRGEILSLLGPNGAGKTTLIKIFTCLVLPDEGQARVGGFDTERERDVKPQIGLVHSDERSFYWRLSARQNLRFFARLYEVPGPRIEARIAELLDRVGMTEAADRPFSTYSSGMKQKIAIVRAMLHDPPILFMDEPTRSLDPASSLSLRRFIRDELQARDGKTILIATHDLSEAESISDRIAILVGGRMRQVGTVDAVRRWGIDRPEYVVETPLAGPFPAGPWEVLADGGEPRRVRLLPAEDLGFEPLVERLRAAGVPLAACDRRAPDLEEAFTRILDAEPPDEAQDTDGADAGSAR